VSLRRAEDIRAYVDAVEHAIEHNDMIATADKIAHRAWPLSGHASGVHFGMGRHSVEGAHHPRTALCLRAVKQRLPQASFREAVISA
jgi:hypothetical protein